MSDFLLIFLVTHARKCVEYIRLCLSTRLIATKDLRNGSLFFLIFCMTQSIID